MPLVVIGIMPRVRVGETRNRPAYLDGLDALAAGKYDAAAKAFGKAIETEEGNASYYPGPRRGALPGRGFCRR